MAGRHFRRLRLGSAPIGLKKSDWELRGLRRGAIGSGPSLLRDLTCTCKCLLRGHMGPAAASNGPPWELHPSTKKPTWRWCQLLRGLLGYVVRVNKTRLDLLPPPPGPSRTAFLRQGDPAGRGATLPWDLWRASGANSCNSRSARRPSPRWLHRPLAPRRAGPSAQGPIFSKKES